MPRLSTRSLDHVPRRPARVVPVPRPGGGVRWMARLDGQDASRYATAVGAVAGRIEVSLGPEVIADRVGPVGTGRVQLEGFASAYARWRRRLSEELADPRVRAVLRTDVARCYPSIERDVVARALMDMGAAPAQVHTIAHLLARWGEDGVRGLPVGPAASAVLANAVLHAVDEGLRAAGVRHLRWVDDVIAFAPDRATASRAFDAYRRALDRVGLRPNEAKTDLVDDPRAVAAALGRHASHSLDPLRAMMRRREDPYRAERVRTLTYPQTGKWVLTDGRHVERVGSGDPPQADRVLDLPGATDRPGLHRRARPPDVDRRRPRERGTWRRPHPPGNSWRSPAPGVPAARDPPVLLSGFDETRWDRPEHPALSELDAVSGSVPLVIVRADGHIALANAAAIEAADVAGLAGAERDAGGALTGRLTRRRGSEPLDLRRAHGSPGPGTPAECGGPGVFARHHHGPRDADAPRHGAARPAGLPGPSASPARGRRAHRRHDGPPARDRPRLRGRRWRPPGRRVDRRAHGGPDPPLRRRGAGTVSPTTRTTNWRSSSTPVTDAGLQVGVHAIGDRGIEQVLSAWERVYQTLDSRERRHFRARRHRIERFEMVSEAQDRAHRHAGDRGLGAACVRRILGTRGALRDQPRTRARRDDEPVPVPAGTAPRRGCGLRLSRSPRSIPCSPSRPWSSITPHPAALPRRGDPPAHRRERTPRASGGEEGVLGPGMHADFVAYTADPFEAPELDDLEPILTVSLGREVFAA